MKPVVTVLMSTYNGEKFIREQIDSILQQEGVSVKLVVRDDGSTDSTTKILQEYAELGKLEWKQGNNLGPAQSFIQLLKEAPPSEYYAFSDQDDFWLPNKLLRGVKMLSDFRKEKALYFTKWRMVDSNLQEITGRSKIMKYNYSFGESLIHIPAAGCTQIFNKPLRDSLIKNLPLKVNMHDSWVYCYSMAIGAKVIVDREETILYRQHANNVIGGTKTFFKRWCQRYKNVVNNKNSRLRTALDLYEFSGQELTEEAKMILINVCGYKKSLFNRIKIAFKMPIKTEGIILNTVTRIMFLCGIF